MILGMGRPRPSRSLLGRHGRRPLAAASSMTLATSAGCDNIATWLDGSTVAFALICFAMLFSCSGSIIRSLPDTTYQKMAPAVFGCAATR